MTRTTLSIVVHLARVRAPTPGQPSLRQDEQLERMDDILKRKARTLVTTLRLGNHSLTLPTRTKDFLPTTSDLSH